MIQNYRNSKKQGDAGLGIAISWFSVHGYTVCVPLTDSQDYDIIVDNGALHRVQVKTTRSTQGSTYIVDLRTQGGNRSGRGKSKKFIASNVDILFVVTGDGTQYLIPSSEVQCSSKLFLGQRLDRFRV